MKIRPVFSLFLLALVIFSFKNIMMVDEIIRRKVENLPTFYSLNKSYDIYCIPSIREAYTNNNFEPFWDNPTKINDLITAITDCGYDGLNPEDYHLSDIKELQENNSPEDMANLDIVLSDAFLLYTTHILAGKIDPINIDPEWHVVKKDKNPVKFLYQTKERNIKDILSGILPKNKNYTALKNQLRIYKNSEDSTNIKPISKGLVIRPGMDDSRVPLIRDILLSTNDLTTILTVDTSAFYDDTLKNAVINFQKRHGLEALGTIGDQTIEALNITLNERIKNIEVNLERLRWLPQELPNYYLMVNIVNFELDVVKDNQVMKKHKVIVGKPFRKTPVFSSTMQYIVFNPTWTVPPTILRNDMIPEIRKSTGYLSKKNIYVYDNKGQPLNPDSVNWKSNLVYTYTYRQEPGKDNALGAVKFMFPNQFNVYLHDTPGKELFQKTERAFSSGCIRVQQPLELAAFLLRDQGKYSLPEIKKIIETAKTQTVVLNEKPEVFLLYLTAWVDENGIINFRKDIYERDGILYQALQEKPVYDIE